jgi:hypothetical protein
MMRRPSPSVAAVALMGVTFAGTLWLWTTYSVAVFFETMRAGFVACFG